MVWTRYDHTERTIGAEVDADLCSLTRGDEAVVVQAHRPPFAMPGKVRKDETIIACFQARGHEVDSERFCVEISWKGGWEDNEVKLADNLKVHPVRDPALS